MAQEEIARGQRASAVTFMLRRDNLTNGRIPKEELASRAQAPLDRVERLIEAELLTPDARSLFGTNDVALVRLVGALEAAGISTDALRVAVAEGLLSFAFLDRPRHIYRAVPFAGRRAARRC